MNNFCRNSSGKSGQIWNGTGMVCNLLRSKIIANPFNSLVISNRMKRLVRHVLVRAEKSSHAYFTSRPRYFVLKTQLLITSIRKSKKALDYVPEIFINQPLLSKSFIILDIKSITQINIQSQRGDNLRPLHRSLLQP